MIRGNWFNNVRGESISPSGYFAKSVQSERKLYHFGIIIIASSFILMAIFNFAVNYSTYISLTEINRLHLWFTCENFIIGATIVDLLCRRKVYNQFINETQNLLLNNNRTIRRYIYGMKLNYSKVFNFLFVYILLGFHFLFFRTSSFIISRLGVMVFVLFYFISLATVISWYIHLQFIIESCVHLCKCFAAINYRVKLVTRDSIINRRMKKLRLMYSDAKRATDLLNVYLIIVVISFFVSAVVDSYNFSTFFVKHGIVLIDSLIKLSNHLIITALLSYHLVSINYYSSSLYDRIYSLSFKVAELDASDEINLLLDRIERADVGITFVKVYTVTPNLIFTLFSIILTIILAAPSLID